MVKNQKYPLLYPSWKKLPKESMNSTTYKSKDSYV